MHDRGPRRGMGVGLLLGGLLALAAPARPAWAQFGAGDERQALERNEPAAIVAEGRTERDEVVSVRIRFHADQEYRAGAVRWQERLRQQLTAINRIAETAFGVRFELESTKRWERKAPSTNLDPILQELEKLDPGADVDWVVGLVAPLPMVSSAIHDLGIARTLGRHFVMRGMANIVELSAFRQAFPVLDRMSPDVLHSIYTRRKEHKEMVIFLHEWAHTLGGIHVGDPTRVLCPGYSPAAGVLAAVDLALVGAALKDRFGARGETAVTWTNLRKFVGKTRAPDWYTGERERLLAALDGLATTDGAAPPPGGGFSQFEADTYNQALARLREQKDEAAWQVLAPLVAASPRRPQVEQLMCRLSGVPAARELGAAACKATLARAGADDPFPFVDAAQAAIVRGERDSALASTREAALRAGRAPPVSATVWLSIGQLYSQLGALSWADEAIGRAPAGADVDKARTQLARTRRFYGLPASGAGIDPAQQPAYAAAFVATNTALTGKDASRAKKARALAGEGLRRFPQAPGLLMLACEASLREGNTPQAHRHCKAALAGMEDLPRAHYLHGHVKLAAGDGASAITSLRRALALDPTEPVYWDSLADIYRGLGRTKDLRALTTERTHALSPRE